MNEVFVKTKEKSKKLAIGLTVLFALSLPFIVAGAVLIGLNIVSILGIVLVVIGIGLFLGNTYAVPNSWQNYKRYLRIEKLIGIVEENKITTFSELKDAMGVSETDLRIMLTYCRRKGFITKSEFEGEVVTLEENANKWGLELRCYFTNCTGFPEGIHITDNPVYKPGYQFRFNDVDVINFCI